MACPYFRPIERFSPASWLREPRSPLGAEWRGVCQADPAAEHAPDEQTQRDTCNIGYGRLSCPRFPANAEADAVRFSVTDERDGAVEVLYVLERDYGPAAHGRFESSRGSVPADLPEPLAGQAAAFLAAHASRRMRA